MSILTKEDRRDLVWAARTSLLEQVNDNSGVLTEGKKAAAKDFIINEATYEQLLNLAFNPERETHYKSATVLEKVALEAYAIVLEAPVAAIAKGAKNIIKPAALKKVVPGVAKKVAPSAPSMFSKIRSSAGEHVQKGLDWAKAHPKTAVGIAGGGVLAAGAAGRASAPRQ